MADLSFTAERRTVLGKQVKQLRRAGKIPGVVYGPAIAETVPVEVERRSFDRFYQSAGHSTLFTLRWDEGSQAVFIREVQQDPIRHHAIHIDFFAPRLDQPVRAVVPLILHQPNPNAEGILTQLRTDVEVEALPRVIPHQFDVDISGLAAVGDALRVGELNLPPGVTLVTAEDEPIAQLSAETVEEPAVAAEIEAAEETPAEAEAATEPGEPSSGEEVG